MKGTIWTIIAFCITCFILIYLSFNPPNSLLQYLPNVDFKITAFPRVIAQRGAWHKAISRAEEKRRSDEAWKEWEKKRLEVEAYRRHLVPKEPAITERRARDLSDAYLKKNGLAWGQAESVHLVKPCNEFDKSDEGGSCFDVHYSGSKSEMGATNKTPEQRRVLRISGDGSAIRLK